MSRPPLVSVCIPSFNQEKYIAETIQSVLDQTYRNFELVISDDYSGDKTVDVIKGFTDRRIRLYTGDKNLGIEGNWNRALKLAGGKYIKLVCGDDLLYPECLEEQVGILEDHLNSSVVLVSCLKDVINKSGKVILRKRNLARRGLYDGRSAIRESVRRGTNILGEPAAGLFRREILEKSGYYNGENLYMIDLDLWSRILLHGDVYMVHKALYAFRISGKSVSAGIGLSQLKKVNSFFTSLYAGKQFDLKFTDLITGSLLAVFNVSSRNLLFLIF